MITIYNKQTKKIGKRKIIDENDAHAEQEEDDDGSNIVLLRLH